MFENIGYFFKRIVKPEQKELGSKDAAKERLHLVLMQDRANVSADFLELMKQEIIDVIKKYIDVDESSIDVRLTNKSNDDGTTGAPALYANIPIVNIKNDMMAEKVKEFEGVDFNKEMGILKLEENVEEIIEEKNSDNSEIEQIHTQEIEENKTVIIENYNNEEVEEKENSKEIETSNENEEIKETLVEDNDEEDDDDVTFDDLLKAAEEEEKVNKEEKDVEEIKSELNESEEIKSDGVNVIDVKDETKDSKKTTKRKTKKQSKKD